jgi:hypothetical protein
MEQKKTNTEKLKELQQIADDYNKLKSDAFAMVKKIEDVEKIMNDLEIKYNTLTNEIKNNP